MIFFIASALAATIVAILSGGIADDVVNLADPGADRILFWDDSDSALEFLTVGNGLDLTTNTLSLSFLGIESLVDPSRS